KNTIDALIAIFKPTIKQKGLKLEVYYDDNIPHILFGQELLLHRIILNLFSNAVKFTEHGAISLEVSLLQKKADKISLKLVIKDTGIGIPEDKQEVIFDKFSRLSSSYATAYKGSGLGLYMVKEYIKKLGGDIKVNSTPGRGAQFTCTVQFKMPTPAQLKKFQALQAIQLAENTIEPVKTKIDILLVEDNELVQKATIFNLKSWGFDKVDVVATGQQAINNSENKKYDLIFLDLGLPDMNGLEVAQLIRKNLVSPSQQTPIIALTAHADEKIKKECMAAQINKVLLKPMLERDVKKISTELLGHPFAAQIIDFALWQKRCGDNRDLAMETQQLMFKQLPEIKNKTTAALNKVELADFNHMIIECYGELMYCGLPALETQASLLIEAIQENKKQEIKKLHQAFCVEIDKVISESPKMNSEISYE
ncbi:MAG: ATP-binding protein, partial [Gammaproteobacteria bacterium]